MNDREMDDLLKKAAAAHPDPEPALLDKIAASIRPTLRPVRPLPSPLILSSALMAICAAIAIGGGAIFGPHGIQAMNGTQKLVFPALSGFIAGAAVAWVAEMIPGSKRRQGPWNLLFGAVFTLFALFPTLFHDHGHEQFIHTGLVCLGAGLLNAVPIALAGWWLLRRGFAVDLTGAALAAGTLAGLGGVAMLELHCPNFEVAHLMVWHVGVIPLSAALAVLAAKMIRIRSVRSS